MARMQRLISNTRSVFTRLSTQLNGPQKRVRGCQLARGSETMSLFLHRLTTVVYARRAGLWTTLWTTRQVATDCNRARRVDPLWGRKHVAFRSQSSIPQLLRCAGWD